MSTTLVLGASRGIGKELAVQLSSNPSNTVYATIRKPNPSLFPDSSKVTTLTLDQTDQASVSAAASSLDTSNIPLDTLILNGAIGDNELILSTSPERLTEYMEVNVVGVLRVVKAFLPALRRGKGKKIVFVSSTSGSLELQIGGQIGFAGPYSVSKAAGNMLIAQFHRELKEEGFTVVAIHPGWVATDMGNIYAAGGMKVEESAGGILKVIDELKVEDSGKFLKFDGTSLPW